MKTCPACASTTFDDMPICYGCLQLFDDSGKESQDVLTAENDLDDFMPEEPPDCLAEKFKAAAVVDETSKEDVWKKDVWKQLAKEGAQKEDMWCDEFPKTSGACVLSFDARFHVVVSEHIAYDIHLCKEKGEELTITCLAQ